MGRTDEYIPEFKKGDILDIESVSLSEGKTSPPDYLTESELIGLMEHHGIGTDASIPTHINNICQRNYVQVSGASRRLIPTNLGIVLIHGYTFFYIMFNNTNIVFIDIVSDHSNDRDIVYSFNALEKIDPELSLPTMRSDMEQQLNLIASGKASHKEVLTHFLKMFEKKFEYFIKSVV